MKTRKRHLGGRRADGFVATSEGQITRKTAVIARFLILFTVLAWLLYLGEQVRRLRAIDYEAGALAETALNVGLVSSLTVSALAYLIARYGYLDRQGEHRRTPRAVIDDEFDLEQPSITVLVPSYREDLRVIRQTLLSAALQEYANLRIVLLIDDPPSEGDMASEYALQKVRDVPSDMQDLFEPECRKYQAALAQFDEQHTEPGTTSPAALRTLADLYTDAECWLDNLADEVRYGANADHTDEFVANEVVGRIGADFASTAAALRLAADENGARISRHRARQLHRRLVWTFQVELWSFERKQFASLSHEPNKAMNLNSYLSLMGKRFSIETCPGARVLVEQFGHGEGLEVPDSDYVVTLDADSVLLPEYCLRLVHFLEQPESATIAVAQTPYSAFPGGRSSLERIAGATTDIQHLVHQGLTRFGATFWVGANAVLRKSAIEELRVESSESGFPITRFVADRTVIEDTESSVDLRSNGWQLYNYPERLSYSATPPDFGSLVVQRKRWANGGLLVLGPLKRLFGARADNRTKVTLTEIFLRLSYLASISWVSAGLLVLLFFPFDQRLLSLVAVATALPYFFATASDLRRCGYLRRDVVGVYALNLLLLPVNLAGTFSSLAQAIGGHKVDFARTPKIKDRTPSPMAFVVAPLILLIWSAYSFARDIHDEFFVRAIFAGTNTVALLYAFVIYVGPLAALVDISAGLRLKTRVPVKAQVSKEPSAPAWASVLYIGEAIDGDRDRTAPEALALSARDQLLTFPAGLNSGSVATDTAALEESEHVVDLREELVGPSLKIGGAS